MINPYSLFSVLSDCDTQTACLRVLNYFDPNRGRNRKTKILNTSNMNLWSDESNKYYEITSTKNLTGYVRNNRYDIILYEPPYNKTITKQSIDSATTFKDILNNGALVVCKVNDFKVGNDDTLYGSYELQNAFMQSGFYLMAKIIYRYNPHGKYLSSFENTDQFTIIHSYFMIFKRK